MTAFANLVGRFLRLNPLLLRRAQSGLKVINADRDVAIRCADLLCPTVVVKGEFKLFLLTGETEEVESRLLLTLANRAMES